MPVDRRHVDALVGDRLRAVRKWRRMTLAQVEETSGGEFRTSVLGAYERGERGLAVTRLLRLAQLYDVPPSELLPEDDQDSEQDDAALQRFPPDSVL
ncbi:helix-turn-helix domain-containing protein [Candidatus Poriferisodalis sp.]|uniref:helix-turn-helix domain-containing protein n=1 Tax=Candidatus Poriferisodalis sp. TaxID=3101277 RepID=UPI003B5CAFF3